MRAFRRRRPEVDVAVLRFTNFIGPRIDSLLTGFFRMPVVPTALGYDARVQLLHEDDALAVLTRATTGDFVGTVNVGGEGTMLLSQAIRRLGRVEVPLPTPALGSVGRLSAPVRVRRLLARADAVPQLRPRRRHDRAAHRVRLSSPVHNGGRLGRLRPYRSPVLPARLGRTRRRARVRSRPRAGRRCRRRGRRPAAPGTPGARAEGGAGCLRPGSSRCGPTTTSPIVPPGPLRLGGRRSPAALDFLRRRLTGEYETDEFGFDPDLADHVLLPAAPAAVLDSWFRVETHGPRERARHRRRAAWWPTTRAPCRSTP